MVHFSEIASSGHTFLVVSKQDSHADEGSLQLLVLPSLSTYVPARIKFLDDRDRGRSLSEKAPADSPSQDAWVLKSPSYLRKATFASSSSLGRSVISGVSNWGSSFKVHGEASFIPKYWEWLEDGLTRFRDKLDEARIYGALCCSRHTYDRDPEIVRSFFEAWSPELNVLETSRGTLSISLWDMYKFAGLSICGEYFEEIIPSREELRTLPRSCGRLFEVFLTLQESKSGRKFVKVTSWINFWYRGATRYRRSSKRSSKKHSSDDTSRNPEGSIPAALPWEVVTGNFLEDLKLGLEEHREAYLAALISCWLCTFVFPNKDGTIRSETFKISSLMATGRCFSMAVPVLSTLFRSINEVSKRGDFSSVCFPIHYLYGWLALYFRTHEPVPGTPSGPYMVRYSGEGRARYYSKREARKYVHGGIDLNWRSNPISKNGDFTIKDDSNLRDPFLSFFLSCRFCYLVSRHEDKFTAEPYIPSAFSRQLGFCQGVPYIPRENKRSFCLEEGLTLWNHSMDFGSGSQLYVPPPSLEPWNCMTTQYHEWWKVSFNNYLLRGLDILVAESPSLPQTGLIRERQDLVPAIRKKRVHSEPSPAIRKKRIRQEPSGTAQGEEVSRRSPSTVDLTSVPAARPSSSTESDEQNFKKKWRQVIPDDQRVSPLPDHGLTTESTRSHETEQAVDRVDVSKSNIRVVTSQVASVITPPVRIDSTAFRIQRRCALGIWEEIKELISRTPIIRSHEIIAEVNEMLAHFENFGEVDASAVRALTVRYIEMASGLSNSSLADNAIKASSEYADEIRVAESKLSKVRGHIESSLAYKKLLSEQLIEVAERLVELRKELNECLDIEASLKVSLEECINNLDRAEAEVANLNEAQASLQQAKDQCEASVELSRLQEKISNFTWEI